MPKPKIENLPDDEDDDSDFHDPDYDYEPPDNWEDEASDVSENSVDSKLEARDPNELISYDPFDPTEHDSDYFSDQNDYDNYDHAVPDCDCRMCTQRRTWDKPGALPMKTLIEDASGDLVPWEAHTCVHAAPCMTAIGEKLELQKRIIRGPWFTLAHVLAVEDACDICPAETEVAYNDIASSLPFSPIGGAPLRCSPLVSSHRRHITHGVPLPARLISGTLSQGDAAFLLKLLS